MKKTKYIINVAYWIGIIADGFVALLLFFPAINAAILGVKSFEITPEYIYISRMAGSLMFGWTILLFWAWLKPINRISVLLITIFPVVLLLAMNNINAYINGVVHQSLFSGVAIMQLIIIIVMSTAYRLGNRIKEQHNINHQ